MLQDEKGLNDFDENLALEGFMVDTSICQCPSFEYV